MTAKIKARPIKRAHWDLFTWELRPASGVPNGSTCTYLDTGEGYVMNDNMWEPDLTNQESYNRNVLSVFGA
jgi:hypothetical protein